MVRFDGITFLHHKHPHSYPKLRQVYWLLHPDAILHPIQLPSAMPRSRFWDWKQRIGRLWFRSNRSPKRPIFWVWNQSCWWSYLSLLFTLHFKQHCKIINTSIVIFKVWFVKYIWELVDANYLKKSVFVLAAFVYQFSADLNVQYFWDVPWKESSFMLITIS